jgi:hypothetical protein
VLPSTLEAENFSDYSRKYSTKISQFQPLLRFEMRALLPYTPHMYSQYTAKPWNNTVTFIITQEQELGLLSWYRHQAMGWTPEEL